MRQRRYAGVPRALRKMHVERRDLVKGGFGLMTGAMLGGLTDDGADLAKPSPPEPEPEVEPPAEPPPEQEPEPEPEATTYRRGDNGPEVRALQAQLGAIGYWCGVPDGGFGQLTQQAVFACQKANDLVRDGIAGPKVKQALATGSRPAPATGGSHVEVHLGTQVILIVSNGATDMVLNTSTANGEEYEFEGNTYTARTPTGDFAVRYVDGTGWRDGELGEMWRPMFYDGNYAIHGSSSIPPWPASHGCARVSVAAMDMIWRDKVMSMGSRVLVV